MSGLVLRGGEVIEAAGPLASAALVTAGAGPDYFSSDRHYEFLARRMLAALRSGRFVLVTGDPPPNSQVLSHALNRVVGFDYTVIVINCGPQLTCEDLRRAVPILAGPRATSAAIVEPERLVPPSPLFVFDGFDRLSDGQIKDVCEGALHLDQMRAAGLLLAPFDFLARLERPALHFLKERLAAHVRVQEVGDDEAIAFLHNQLLAQRDRRIEARGFRHGILIGLAASGIVLAASIGLFLTRNPTAEQIRAAPENTGERRTVSEEGSMLRPAEEPATNFAPAQAAPKTETGSASATTPLPPPSSSVAESPPPVAPSAIARPPADLHSSDAEIPALLRRGDAFLTSGDITSARLFYERAAEAGSGPAALLLGATFDPVMFGHVGAPDRITDPAQALAWYRRARDLGMVEAEQRIKRFETPSRHERDTPSH
jgi:hypothetical protein